MQGRLAAASLGEAVKLCIEATGVEALSQLNEYQPSKVTVA